MMKVLALTGGIGSGKSFVLKIFSSLGIPVYSSDDRTKEIYLEDKDLQMSLMDLLGTDIVKDGVLNTKLMASKIFGNDKLKQEMEDIVFPKILKDIHHWISLQEGSKPPFVIIESAIVLEKDIFKHLADKVLTISSPLEIRIKRVNMRDGWPEDKIMDRINHQWSDSQRESKSDYIIISNNEKALLPQVLSVYNKMINS